MCVSDRMIKIGLLVLLLIGCARSARKKSTLMIDGQPANIAIFIEINNDIDMGYGKELKSCLKDDFCRLISQKKLPCMIVDNLEGYVSNPKHYFIIITLDNYYRGGISKRLSSHYKIIHNDIVLVNNTHHAGTKKSYTHLIRRLSIDIMADLFKLSETEGHET